MSSPIIEPIYEANAVQSKVEFKDLRSLDDINRCFNDINNGTAVIWLFSEIKTVKIQNGNSAEELSQIDLMKYLVKARLFNEQKEWHLWRTGNNMKGRCRLDGSGEYCEYVASELPLKSIIAKTAVEMGGVTGKKVKLITRNYIDYQNNQAGYFDMRFVGLKS